MKSNFKTALLMFVVLSVVTGLIYPGAVTGIAQLAMGDKADGSLIVANGKAVGSDLIGQPFSGPHYFWGRPSATSPQPNNGLASSGSNQGPTNPALVEAVEQRIKALRDADPGNKAPIPADLVSASGSGLDPHISPAAAEYQVGRVARTRNLDPQRVRTVVERHTRGRQFGILGEPRVNVLQVNRSIDALK
jgi:K+-transporting ATPase ATPase C chain